jgi:hypothetical protein
VEYGLEYNTGKDEGSVACPQGCGMAIQQILLQEIAVFCGWQKKFEGAMM